MSDRQLLALTEEIYDAATGGTPWTAVGQGLTRLVQAQTGSIMIGDCTGKPAELLYHVDIPLDAWAPYRAHYRSVDLWTNRAAEAVRKSGPATRPRVWMSGVLVPDREFLRSEFYVDFGQGLGLRYVLGTVLPLGAAGIAPIGLHRPDGEKPFSEADAKLLECLLPHLRRALQLRHQLRTLLPSASPGLAALDALSLGVLVVDADLQLLVANVAAETIASSGSGLRFMRGARCAGSSPTVIRAFHHDDSKTLGSLVRATALGGSCGGAVRLRDAAGTTAMAALVAPLPSRLSSSSGKIGGRVAGQALILLRDLTVGPALPEVDSLRSLFGLTRTEAEVARALLGGTTKSAVAARRGLQVSTIRTQVRAILQKTGAANLRDLERLFGGLQSP